MMPEPPHRIPPALTVLQTRPQWVCWRKEQRTGNTGKPTKIPYDPRTGKRAEVNNPTTWTSYAQARTAWKRQPQRYDGIGFMFHDDITGIDLDHCIDTSG